jgi:tetratricopeptide (TPR) repeat protein
MKYDRLGFPIPPEFVPTDERVARGSRPSSRPDASPGFPAPSRPTAGRTKRLVLIGVLAAVLLPAVVMPGIMPAIGEAVMQWSLERAIAHEGRGDLRSAVRDLTRAIGWTGPDGERRGRLLCWRAMLRIENRDPRGAKADAEAAIAIAPTLTQPRRVRALAHVILNEPDGALADAQTAVELAPPGDPEALNHRAYIRALVGRDLDAALADVDAALAEDGTGPSEFLDTKGFVLHLLGRHHEAVDLLNVAVDLTQKQRRELVALRGHADPDELAYRLRSLDHGLAVMLHHRGLACQALGLAGQARQDFETAERKGYAPERGIF